MFALSIQEGFIVVLQQHHAPDVFLKSYNHHLLYSAIAFLNFLAKATR